MARKLVTSESVTEGHPDKICDCVSDAILDEMLKQDPNSRVAIECLTTTGTVHVAGEVTTDGYVDVQNVVRDTLKDIGYTDPEFGIDCDDAGVWISIHEQSPDISQGVTEGEGEDKDQGAGDQGMMYGYATNETEEYLPLPIMLAHKLTKRLSYVRKEGILEGVGPDGKSQITVLYEDGEPKKVTDIVIAQQHTEEKGEEELRRNLMKHVIEPVCEDYMDEQTTIHINATGRFVVGGPEGDSGVTGRKIIVDTYGGVGRHGGGCFSGKDPSKVDRSGAYAARWVAKNVVAAGLADRCEIMVSYAIGVANPTGININCFGTEKVEKEKIRKAVKEVFDLRPKAIIEDLDLKRPIYRKTASYGHFGRDDPDFSWEKTNKADELKKVIED